MNVLLLGSGGRENAFAWKIAQSPKLTKLYIAPGNAGTYNYGLNVDLDISDFSEIKTFVLEKNITMVVVGPEQPLVDGIHDQFLADESLSQVAFIGPQKIGAQLEGSKDFAKAFMTKYNIPTAAYASFTKEQLADGLQFLKTLKPPYVLKADGLSAGKGVLILNTLEEAEKELEAMLAEAKFGRASEKVVIEEYLNGIELSVFVLTDGKSYKILPAAKDYKRIGEGDTGLNTGGMGAVSPVPFADADFMQKVDDTIIKPTIEGLEKEHIPYAGFIFIGLMNVDGDPYVIEYNVRMGDPETEVVFPRIASDVLDLFEGIALKQLSKKALFVKEAYAVGVVLAAKGYPQNYEKGQPISSENGEDSLLFHAGTKIDDFGQVLTNGGRVMVAVGLGERLPEAISRAYEQVMKVKFEGKNFRKDIGKDLLKFI